jgi:hypothetical protein
MFRVAILRYAPAKLSLNRVVPGHAGRKESLGPTGGLLEFEGSRKLPSYVTAQNGTF